MPNSNRRQDDASANDFDVTCRIMDTISRQIESYRVSLGYIVSLREESKNNPELLAEMRKSPESMVSVLESRGIPAALAYGMASEDYGGVDFGGSGQLALWTWDCCCTNCCITNICGTTNVNQ